MKARSSPKSVFVRASNARRAMTVEFNVLNCLDGTVVACASASVSAPTAKQVCVPGTQKKPSPYSSQMVSHAGLARVGDFCENAGGAESARATAAASPYRIKGRDFMRPI